jgi:hypothetical protein
VSDTEKVVPFSASFSGMASNQPWVRERLKVWYTKATAELRQIDHEDVPNDVAEQSLKSEINYAGSGYSDATLHMTEEDVPHTRQNATDIPPAPPAGPDSSGQ